MTVVTATNNDVVTVGATTLDLVIWAGWMVCSLLISRPEAPSRIGPGLRTEPSSSTTTVRAGVNGGGHYL